MNQGKTLTVAGVAVGFCLSAVVAATPEESARIAQLEARLAQLEAQQARVDGAIAQARAVDAAIADAQARSRFLVEGFTSGWDNGFQLGSADGAYTLRPYVEFQFRNVSNWTRGNDMLFSSASEDDFENGFEVRRMKIGIRGNLFSKDFTYNFRLNAARSGGATTFDLAYGQYQFADAWAIRFGQFKLNWTQEETVSDIRQLTAERSLLNQILGGSRTQYVQGVALLYGAKDRPLRGELALTDGDLSANTDYTDQKNSSTAYQNFGVGGRLEYKVKGDWSSYNDFSALRTKEELLVFGGGFDWVQGGDADVLRLTADVQWESPAGVSAYGGVIYTAVNGSASSSASAVLTNAIDDAWGGIAQLGYVLPDAKQWELFGRYSITKLNEPIAGEDAFHELTVGVNRFYYGHNAKLTIDAGWLPNGSPENAGGLGVKGSSTDQVYVRAQIQLVL